MKNYAIILFLLLSVNSRADSLGDFIQYLAPPSDPTPVALKPIAKLQEAAMAAISFVGKPYFWGGTNPDQGFDCSGLVQYVLVQSGVKKLLQTGIQPDILVCRTEHSLSKEIREKIWQKPRRNWSKKPKPMT